jgi:hypothetical protein
MLIPIQEHGNRTKLTNKPGFLSLEKAFVPSEACVLPITYFTYIMLVKLQLFVTLKSEKNPDLDPHWFGSLDPDPDLDPY